MSTRNLLACTGVLAVAWSVATTASALDLVKGYERGANLANQLGDQFILDQAATGGGDAAVETEPSSFGWVAQYTDLWEVGADVSLTGVAIPIFSNTNAGTNSTQNGDWTFTFFELSGGASPNAFDGYDFGTMTGEPVLGSVTAAFSNYNLDGIGNQTDEYFLKFDTPLNFTAASTGLAFHMQSTSTMRVKVNTPSPTRRAARVSLGDGAPLAGANSSFAATLAGTPVALDPPPPPSIAHRIDAALETPGNRIWETIAPSTEQYGFPAPRAGDYNGDGFTDAADYTIWRDNLDGDATITFADGSRDPSNTGAINAADYDYWRSNYGGPTSVQVNDPSVPGISRAYTTGVTGQANVYEGQVNGTQASRQDGSFEVWFKPDDLNGGDQVVFEVGGTGTGSYLSLQGDQLSFYINGQFDGNEQTVSTTLSDADWTQVAVVIHNTFDANNPSIDDFVDLYVDGALVATTASNPTDINDWAGGNQAGVGHDGGNLAAGGPISGDTNNVIEFPFQGQIAIFEYATGAWDATEVLTRYNALTTQASLSAAAPEPSAVVLFACLAMTAPRRRPRFN